MKVENNKENVMTPNEITNKAFKLACQYLQYNAPSALVTYEPDEIRACYGSASYKDGWKQWAKYFVHKVKSNTDIDLVKMLREGI